MKTDASGRTVEVAVSHVALTALWLDAVGRLPGGQRLFIPRSIPCGDCAACRRALCSACTAAREALPLPALVAPGQGPASLTLALPERYLCEIDLPSDPAPLPAEHAAAAGVVAAILDAAARAGLRAGHTVIWIGGDVLASIGAEWAARRGCRSFQLGAARGAGEGPVTRLAVADGPAGWAWRLDERGDCERRIFVCGRSPVLARAALAVCGPGSVVSFLRGAPPLLAGLDRASPLHVRTGEGYHPDFVAEALAAIRRGEVDLATRVRSTPRSDVPGALARLRAGREPHLPVVAL